MTPGDFGRGTSFATPACALQNPAAQGFLEGFHAGYRGIAVPSEGDLRWHIPLQVKLRLGCSGRPGPVVPQVQGHGDL